MSKGFRVYFVMLGMLAALFVGAGCAVEADDAGTELEPGVSILDDHGKLSDEALADGLGDPAELVPTGCSSKTVDYCVCLFRYPCGTTTQCNRLAQCLDAADARYPACRDDGRPGSWTYDGPSDPSSMQECLALR